MRHPADDWQKALLSGVLIGSILFLTLLPSLGWAWHRVLPEHTHIFIGAVHSHEDEIVPPPPVPDEEQGFCYNCSGTQISSGVVHLPGDSGLQVLGVAALGALLWIFAPPGLSERISIATGFYQPPLLFPLDPPPNASI